MLNDTKTYLRAILKAVPVKSILELGSGLRSTPFLGNIMEQRQGKMTTLETDPTWYQTVCEKVKFKCLTPVLCNFYFDEKLDRYTYDWTSDEKFDLILIDGPGKLRGRNLERFEQLLGREDFCLTGMSGGPQSVSVLDYVLPFAHKDTVIVVDGRRAAVMYYLSKRSADLVYMSFGNPYIVKDLKALLKPQFQKLAKKGICEASAICHKDCKYLDSIPGTRM